jgi:hypothetical protein
MTTKVLVESVGSLESKSADGTYPVVLITPGKGASGVYSEQLIESYAPAAWPKGTHVYLDHLKPGETRTPEKLLGTLAEETSIDAEGRAVNRFKPLSKHREWIEEISPFVGLSISAQGTGREEVDESGQTEYIVETLEPHITNTVDVVSYAGRGGKFLESFLEEANASAGSKSTQAESTSGATKGTSTMTLEEQVSALIETVSALVAKIDAREVAEAAKADADHDVRAEVAQAVDAAVAVESADVAKSTHDALIEQIKAGAYDVNGAIEAEKALREEIRAEFEAKGLIESVGSSAAGGASTSDDLVVTGW